MNKILYWNCCIFSLFLSSPRFPCHFFVYNLPISALITPWNNVILYNARHGVIWSLPPLRTYVCDSPMFTLLITLTPFLSVCPLSVSMLVLFWPRVLALVIPSTQNIFSYIFSCLSPYHSVLVQILLSWRSVISSLSIK